VKIMHFCCEYPPSGYGVGKYIGEISAGLRKLGHETIIVTTRVAGLPEEEVIDQGKVYRLYDEGDIGDPALARRVLSLARDHQVDVIESVERLGEAAELLKHKHRPPVLINCRYNDIVHQARYAQAWYRWQRVVIDVACFRQRKRLARELYSIEHADLLAAPSQWMIDGLRAQGVRLPAKTMVLPKPLSSLPAWENGEAEEPTVLLVARLDFGKGLLYLRDLLYRIQKHVPNVRLEIAGPDSYARFIGSVRKWTEKHLGPMIRHVRFLGALSPSELDAAYRRAWVVVIPSRWDTSPTVLLEAMVRSKAIVVSPNGGMAEYLGSMDWVADPAGNDFSQKLVQLLQSRELRSRIGNESQQRAALHYAPGMAAEKYIDFIRTLGI
jgi:glycosyltransferase involved in cell wall biosynthesis